MKIGIIGNNVAGISVAKKIRELDENVEIAVFSQEKYHYYSRPQLINYIAGDTQREDLFFYKENWYEDHKIQVFLDEQINKLDPETLTLISNKNSYSFDKIIVASGSYSFVPPIPGKDLKNVFALRTLDDAEQIKKQGALVENIVLIGGGVLGLETANALHKLNPSAKITVLELAPYLLPRQLDKEGANVITSILNDNGIIVKTGVKIQSLDGLNKVEKVVLEEEGIPAEMVILSAGVRPYLDLAKKANIDSNRGILVNDFLETSCKNIYALGDSVEHKGMLFGIIKPIWDMFPVVAENVLKGNFKTFSGFTMSKTVKLLDFYVTSIGDINPENETDYEIIRSVTDIQYKKYVLKENILKGFISVGPKVKDFKIQQMIKEEKNISEEKKDFENINFNL